MRLCRCGPAVLLLAALAEPARAQCPEQTFDLFEAQGYAVRMVRVSGPLVNGAALRDQVVAPILQAGARLTAAQIEAGKHAVRMALRQQPSLLDSLVAATIVIADVDACDLASKELDVVYRVFTTRIPLALSRTVEGHGREEAEPAARLAMASAPTRYRISPLVRYDALEEVVGGAGVALTLPGVFDQLLSEVAVSQTALHVDVEVAGSQEADARLVRALEWRGGYHRHDRPTGGHTLVDERFGGQISALTRPLGSAGAVLRFSSSLEGGESRTDFLETDLPSQYVADAGYGAWRSAGGVTLRTRRHGFSASYGVELGFTGGSALVDYTKSVGELVYDGHLAASAAALRHRPLEVVSRFGAGRLSGTDGVPAAARFFGGSSAVPFLAGEGWDFRSGPVVRSFPALSFGDSFLSYNLTASLPLWLQPLVPAEVAADPFIREGLAGQLNSAESTLETSYKMADPAHRRALTASQPLKRVLESIRARISELAPTLPETLKTAAQTCTDQAEIFLDTVDAISPHTYVGAVLTEPVDEEDATLPSVIRACVDDLSARLGDAALARSGSELAAIRAAIASEIAQIDVASARRLAARDMQFARSTVSTVMDEMNRISLGPIFVFDAVRLGQRESASDAVNRFGIGTGIRLSIASSFHLSTGYVWNMNRAATERRGAAFAAVELSTLLGR